MKRVFKRSSFNLARRFTLRLQFLIVIIFTLGACGSQNDTATDSQPLQDNVSFLIPDAILGAKLNQNVGKLTATISINSGPPLKMSIFDTTASITLHGIPTGEAILTIIFTYDLPLYGPLVVASATKSLLVSTGENPVNFATEDYDTESFDADKDGISNILELDELSTSSPVVSVCVLDLALLNKCELGS